MMILASKVKTNTSPAPPFFVFSSIINQQQQPNTQTTQIKHSQVKLLLGTTSCRQTQRRVENSLSSGKKSIVSPILTTFKFFMDTADQWPQEAAPPSDQYSSRSVGDQKKLKPQKDQAPLNCPRCHSTNTKFCYYNNYSLTQPRYFCKACRRYWTAGGSLRNVPVGGGSRKNKRSNPLVSKSGNSDDHLSSHFSFQNPNNLNLAFPPATQDYNSLDASRFLQVPSKKELNNKDNNIIQLNLNSSYSTSSTSTSTSLSAMELLKLNSTSFSHTFVPVAPVQNPNMIMQYASGFHFQEFNKPQVGFAVDGHGNKYEAGLHNANNHENINGTATDHHRLNFPFGGPPSKHHTSTNGVDNKDKVDGNPTLYWNGMSSGGSW